jgi:uncharacterized protein (TIGR03083 family)
MSLPPPPPILTAQLFPRIEALLLELLRSLDATDWERPTLAPGWTVKDVAGHLLDTSVRKLSVCRDGWTNPDVGPRPGEDLVAFVNRVNRDGVAFWRRLSPRMLIALLEPASVEYTRYHQSLDPFAEAAFGVSWAGETRSLNWFDTAREYTERWHHQQQIRVAVGRPGIETRDLYHPVLDCFMRALPFTFRDVERPAGTLARFTVSGEAGGTWFLHRAPNDWQLTAEAVGKAVSETIIPQSIAWRLFTKGIDRGEAAAQVEVRGDEELGRGILGMVSIVG